MCTPRSWATSISTFYGSTVKRSASMSCVVFPSENRWFANRVQNNFPIFAIDSPLRLGKVIRDSAQCAHLEQPGKCAEESTAGCFAGLAYQYFKKIG